MEKTAKAVKEAIVGERMPKFGLGQKQKEMECEKIHVYMQCLLGGGVAVEPIRALLSPSQTIEDARKVYLCMSRQEAAAHCSKAVYVMKMATCSNAALRCSLLHGSATPAS